ncbi:C40 family peptidase [Pseudomonas aeruginosa]
MHFPVAAFPIVVFGSIIIDSKADDFSSRSWLRSSRNVLDGREIFFTLPVRARRDDTLFIQVNVRRFSAARTSGARQRIVNRAYELVGTPYSRGGMSLSKGFDCSGLLVYLFRSEVGLELPRTTAGMVREDYPRISKSELQPGDAVFFATNEGERVDHVGLYVGNHKFIHAPRPGKHIRVDSLKNSYWSSRYYGARRFDSQS